MRKKLFVYFLLSGLLAAFLCCACSLAVMADQLERQTLRQLREEASLAAMGYDTEGDAWFKSLQTGLRLTHVSADGTVLFDSRGEAPEMENHLDREEIIRALEDGSGEAIHRSETLMERTLYYALRLNDGSVLRVSCTQRSALSVLIDMMPLLAGVLLAVTALCVPLAARLASKLVRPINAVDPDNPRAIEVYPELSPLVGRLEQQKMTIREKMEALLQSQREFTAITENMSEGFLLLNSRMEVISGNHAAFRLLQADKAHTPVSLKKICGLSRIVTAAQSALAGIRDEDVLPVGNASWQMIASPVSAEGRLSGAVILLLDVTERERREALRMEFSANVSHELKTPLTTISGYAEMMKEGLLPPDRTKDAAGAVYRESQRLIALIGDIIYLSQLDEGKDSFGRESVDLYRLAGEVADSLRLAADSREIGITVLGESQTVIGIPHVLREMLFNLCDNAVKYSDDGGSVTIGVRKEQGHVRVSVSDRGIGIPYADQPRVFERFYRADKSRSRALGGTGLGLSIVKHGAQLHHASIELESEPGRGTTVTLVF